MTQIITIQDNTCWRCGNEFIPENLRKTSHHAIPKNLKPKKNITIPVCSDCHKEINLQDINSLRAYAYKIMKTLQSIPKGVKDLIEKLDNLAEKGEVIKSDEDGE